MTMQCQVLRDEILDVLYGEASPETARRLEDHLASCAACREEMEALKGMRRDLAEWKLPPLSAARPPAVPRPGLFWLAAAATLLVATGAALGLSGSELSYANGRLAVRLGRGPDVQQLLAEQDARHRKAIDALRASLGAAAGASGDRAALLDSVQAIVKESEARQAERLNASLRDISTRTEAQRRYDLARVSAGLSYLDGKTGQHVARTSELMGYVLQASEKK
jgi:anti-sigma factor RsiW